MTIHTANGGPRLHGRYLLALDFKASVFFLNLLALRFSQVTGDFLMFCCEKGSEN